MRICINPARDTWKKICQRPSDSNDDVRERVAAIIGRVRRDGDRALKKLSSEIDGFVPESILVREDEFVEAEKRTSNDLKEAIERAYANIYAFHKAQMPVEIDLETAPGVKCIQKPVPISKVGIYIPGGTAPLFSTVLMLAIPARIAGCREVILCTPAQKDGRISPAVLYAARRCGVDKVFRTGGAQAIAAMAYGTESIPAVDKIFGPGNQYVTAAKQMLGGSKVAIDMPAGPSEVMVIADSRADAAFVASDLLSQAEHGRDSQVMLVCNDASFAEKVEKEVLVQIKSLSREELAEASLDKSCFVVLPSEDDIVEFANTYAPEHLIVVTENPWKITGRIECAGSVFVGRYTPESAGDYASGTNHTLPTSAWARSYSGVNIESFIRRMTIQEISREGLEGLGGTIITMAEAEGLQAHANAVKLRLKK